jgi:hypothetical protein
MNRFLELSQPPERDEISGTSPEVAKISAAPPERDLFDASPESAGAFLPPVAPACGRPPARTPVAQAAQAGLPASDRLSRSLDDVIDVLSGLEHLPARKLRRMIRLRLSRLRAERLVADLGRRP